MNETENSQLIAARNKIDEIDASIWSLLKERFVLSKELAKIKGNFQLPILDEKREQAVLAKISGLSCDAEISSAIAQLYKLLFELSRKYQGKRD